MPDVLRHSQYKHFTHNVPTQHFTTGQLFKVKRQLLVQTQEEFICRKYNGTSYISLRKIPTPKTSWIFEKIEVLKWTTIVYFSWQPTQNINQYNACTHTKKILSWNWSRALNTPTSPKVLHCSRQHFAKEQLFKVKRLLLVQTHEEFVCSKV